MASDLLINPGDNPRRRIDRETTPGRCGNLDYCSIGMQRVQVRVPISAPFVCPECGGRLRPPGRLAGVARPWLLPLLRAGVLVAAIVGSLGVGYTIGHVQPALHRAVQNAGDRLTALGTAPPPPPAKPAAPPPPALAAAVPQALPVFVGERPYPTRDLPVDISNPPDHLMREAKFGQVTLDCTLEAVLTHPTCKITDIRGADAFSAAAIVWLQGLAVQYAPSSRTGTPTLLDHRWRVVLQDFSGSSDPNLVH